MNKYFVFLMIVFLCSGFQATAGTDTIVTCRDTTVCLLQSDFQIVVCSPYGGHYFGPGVKDTVENTYVPFWAGVGTHQVTYRIGTFTCKVKVTIIDAVNAGPIVGNYTICSGGSAEKYQIMPDSTARLYHWKIPQWNDFKDSTTSSSNIIHYDNSFHGGTLQASVHNQCGEGLASSMQIQVLPDPVPVIKNLADTLSLTDNICKNQQVTYYAHGDFDSCRFTVQGGTFTGCDTSRLVTVKWSAVDGMGELAVTAYNNGCSATCIRNVSIGEGTAPDPATIWLFGYNMLVCSDSTANSYCWFQDNNVYTGFVSPSGRYILPEPLNKQSTYYVRTGSISSCTSCYNDSKPFKYSAVGFDDLANIMHIVPNPAHDNISVKLRSGIDPEGWIFLFNRYGAIVGKKNVTMGNVQIDLSHLPAGLYFIEYLSSTGSKHRSKVIKL